MEETCFVRLNTRVEEEYERWLCRLSDAERGGWKNVIGAVQKLGSAFPVKSFPEFIDLAEVVSRRIVFEVTQVTLCLAAFLQPGEMRIDICLASSAAEGTLFAEVNC